MHLPLAALVSVQHSLDAFLAIEKYLLVKRGVFTSTIVRGPVGYRLDAATRPEVDRLFEMLKAWFAETKGLAMCVTP